MRHARFTLRTRRAGLLDEQLAIAHGFISSTTRNGGRGGEGEGKLWEGTWMGGKGLVLSSGPPLRARLPSQPLLLLPFPLLHTPPIHPSPPPFGPPRYPSPIPLSSPLLSSFLFPSIPLSFRLPFPPMRPLPSLAILGGFLVGSRLAAEMRLPDPWTVALPMVITRRIRMPAGVVR